LLCEWVEEFEWYVGLNGINGWMTLIIISQPVTSTMLNIIGPPLHLLGHKLEAHLVGKADIIHSNGGLEPVAVSSVPRL